MPLYEYTCEKCGHKWPVLRPIDKRGDPIECPKCRGNGKLCMSLCSVHADYSDIEHFGDPRYTDARAKQCGVPT